ncbi:hypothetical protein ACWD48_06055 [Streptomyces sp. NPDC002519]
MADTLAVLAGRIAALERLVRDLSRASRLANSSIENGSITVYDDAGVLRGSIGLQTDGTVALAAVNGPTPPVPTAPAIAPVLGGVAVTWDGQFADGSQAPADFAHVEVHFSTSADFPDDDSLFAAFYSTQGGTMTVPAGVPVWVRLVCVSTSGKDSGPSAVAGPIGPAPVIAQEVLDGIVTELSLADGAVSRAKLEAGAVDGTVLADGAVTTPKLVAGEINGLVLAAGTVNADRLVAASITAAQIKALGITGDRLAANTVTAAQMAAGTITAASGVISSIDASVITVGKVKASQIDATSLVVSGANVSGTVASAAAAGTATTAGSATTVTGSIGAGVSVPPTQMGTGQIPQTTTINGASILTNTLDAGSIKAGTISVDRLTVGLAGQVGQKWYDFGDSASKWLNSVSGTMATVAVADAQSGGNVMRCVGFIQGAYRPDVKIPFDPSVTYRVSARARQTVANSTPGTNQKLFVGVAGLAADGVTFVNLTGANALSNQFYVAADSETLTAGAGWVQYTGYIKGTSASPVRQEAPNANAPAQLHAGVRYITPILYANYTGGTGTVELDMFAIEVVETGGITASNIKAGAIDGQTITGATLQTAKTGNRVQVVNGTYNGHPVGEIDFFNEVDTARSGKIIAVGPVDGLGAGLMGIGPGSDTTSPWWRLGFESEGIPPKTRFEVSADTTYLVGLRASRGADIGGIFTAGNMAWGFVSITPTAPNTPTSVMVQGLSVAGSTFHAFVTANSGVPGTSMLGVSAASVSSTGLTVWLTRSNTATTTVYWMLIGS